jgi:zinc protease
MRRIQLVLLAAASLGAAPGLTAQQSSTLPKLAYSEFRLPNGLRVILHEDHSTPIAAVNVWYHVGSKNETPGKTGYAHLFEHMMFQGSRNYIDDFFRPLQEVGGTLNGSTNQDRTNYYEIVPSNYLELAMFMEADRMGGLLDALTEDKLANQRDVVKNEKRQNYDNQPYGLARARIAKLLYPKDHPYNWLTIGELEDLTAASMDDIKGFFRRYYTPNNASLVIAGDINPAEARRLATKYFGKIPRGPALSKLRATQPVLTGEIRGSMEDRVALARRYLVWHSVPEFHGDEPALDYLAAILGGGRTSRLYKDLVYDRQIAQDVNAGNGASELAGLFQITVTPRRGQSMDSAQASIDREIAKIAATPPSQEELDRIFNVIEARTILGLQTVGGFGSKSDRLNNYAVMRGTPNWLRQDLARYRTVKPADVQRAARKYLTSNRLVFDVNPARAGGAATTASAAVGSADSTSDAPRKADPRRDSIQRAQHAALPKGGPAPKLTLPRLQRKTLSNGLEILLVEHHELPIVTLNLAVKSGAASDPADRAGLASVTAALLDRGTARRTALDLASELQSIGANLNASAGWDATTISLTTLKRHLGKALDIYSDAILNPAFAEGEVTRIKTQRLGQIAQNRDNATQIAAVVYPAILYGSGHPYGHPSTGNEASVRALTASDIRAFYATNFLPNNSALIVVGDVTMSEIVGQLEKSFGSWKAGQIPENRIADAPARDRAQIYLVDRPGAAQSVINIGTVGLPRSTPDYFALQVLNTMLGGQFMSRVNLNLREDKGYSYGARTAFDFRRAAGPFTASAGVQTAVTKQSVVEFLKELRGIRGEIPITEAELNNAKQSLILGYPRGFETPAQIAARLSDVVQYGLPDDYFNNYITNISKVTAADVNRVANASIKPGKLAILVVGDRKVIEPGLRSLEGIGATVTVLDAEGNPVPASSIQ